MSIRNPIDLVDEYKKSGEFDRLRRELLAQFKHGESIHSFLDQIEDITREKLKSDVRLRPLISSDARHHEFLQELERFPLVEKVVSELPAFSNPSFSSNIRKTLTKILEDDKNGISVKEPGEDTMSSLLRENGDDNVNGTYDTIPASESTEQPLLDNKVTQNVILSHDMSAQLDYINHINGVANTADHSLNSPIQFDPIDNKDADKPDEPDSSL